MASDITMISATTLLGTAILALTILRGWQGWLRLKERELESRRPTSFIRGEDGANLIEMADLKERIRKLEAIAAGVDL